MRTIWLASYPKSGNTWMRMLIGALSLKDGEALDINALPESSGIATARGPFDHLVLIDSGLLTHDEIDTLRPGVYEVLKRVEAEEHVTPEVAVRFVKTHDAYTYLPDGTPLLAGRAGADGAVLIVRDPRGVAPSLADHNGLDLEGAVIQLGNPETVYCGKAGHQHRQLRHRLLNWSGHAQSWLGQSEIPVHLVRYEDMIADTAGSLAQVLLFAGLSASAEQIERAVSLCAFPVLRALEDAKGFGELSRRSSTGRFFRSGEAAAWREALNREQIARIETAHAPMMRRFGYPLYYATEPCSDGETCSASDLATAARQV